MSDILNKDKMDSETIDNLKEDMADMIWELSSRLIVIAFFGVFGYIQLFLLSKGDFATAVANSANTAYVRLGILIPVYIVLPIFRRGIEYRGYRVGKILLLVSVAGVILPFIGVAL